MNVRSILVAWFLSLFLGCQSAPKLNESGIAANKAKASESFQLALQRSQEGKKDSAEALFREALDLDSGTMEHHLGLAGFLARTGRESDAFEVYQGALQRFGERPEIYEEQAFVHNESGNIEAAIVALRKAVDLRSKMVDSPENREWMQKDQEGIKALSGG